VLNGPVTDGWEEQDDALVRVFEFGSFPSAIDFVVRLADAAESANHHPDIDIRFRRVTVRWTTHSAGGITAKDREMAELTSTFAST
jgi:4a-hydroxytetrahydrobiopterin dehydratase